MKHFSHEHPLKLIEKARRDVGDEEEEILCDGCRESVILGSAAAYGCNECKYILHKKCAELTKEINHPMHLEHPLTLHSRPPYESSECICNICRIQDWKWFTYHCSICEFDVHLSCALLVEDVIIHEGHHHPLTFVPRYFAHLKCATLEKKPLMLRSSEDYFDSDLMNFPLPDKSIDLISRLVKSTTLEVVNDVVRDQLIDFSHDHPLILVEVQSNDAEIMINKEVQCHGCVQPVSVPFYTCRDCNFFLHKCCAELPEKIFRHPLHPQHPLSLYSTKYLFTYWECDLCKKYFSGFYFFCQTCNFRLDVQCACLPKAINHDAHNHPLKLEAQSSSSRICSGCGLEFAPGSKYECGTCGEFELGSHCASLPRTFKHEWDRHPLTLSYPPFSYHPDEFICEICEEDIHPNYWLYHCRQCDQSFHTKCIKPFDWYSKVKFGGTLEVENHPHPLVFVRKSKNKKSPSICSQCGRSRDGYPVLECAPCNFQLCIKCCYSIVESLSST
ncbi:hypothetical protein LguiB_033628 [Lonicera macranthoides]